MILIIQMNILNELQIDKRLDSEVCLTSQQSTISES